MGTGNVTIINNKTTTLMFPQKWTKRFWHDFVLPPIGLVCNEDAAVRRLQYQ